MTRLYEEEYCQNHSHEDFNIRGTEGYVPPLGIRIGNGDCNPKIKIKAPIQPEGSNDCGIFQLGICEKLSENINMYSYFLEWQDIHKYWRFRGLEMRKDIQSHIKELQENRNSSAGQEQEEHTEEPATKNTKSNYNEYLNNIKYGKFSLLERQKK